MRAIGTSRCATNFYVSRSESLAPASPERIIGGTTLSDLVTPKPHSSVGYRGVQPQVLFVCKSCDSITH